MNKDHVVSGSLAVIITTNLPSVLSYYQGPQAPVAAETALAVMAGAVIYAGLRLWWNRSAAKSAAPAPASPTVS